MQAPITGTEERYLSAIGRLAGDDVVSGAALARALGLSPPTVHEMLNRLDAGGLASRGARRGWKLTTRGRRQLDTLEHRREGVERFLREILEVPEADIPAELERIVPNVSPHLERRMRAATSAARRPDPA